jgi:hypothetical protein
MLKQKNIKKLTFIFSVILMASAIACSPMNTVSIVDAENPSVIEGVDSAENTPIHATIQTDADAELTQTEIEGLIFMREEEKLAGDVYRYFYDLWGSSVFQSIASSEDSHTAAILTLLDLYGIPDPFMSEAGIFQNADLQALYDQLTAQGSQSLKDALLVGAAIEEIDILDLERNIAATDQADIIMTYENLLSGSENHLRAFVRVLGNQNGETYTPQYLSQEQYDAIMLGSSGQGLNGGGLNIPANGQGRGRNAS